MQISKPMMAAATAALLFSAAAGPTWAQSQPDTSPVTVKGVTVTAVRPERPAGPPPALEAYATPAVFELAALSPDGSQVATVVARGGGRFLITRRFSDKATQVVRIAGGPVSSVTWGDESRVLVDDGVTTLRGTCEANDQRAIEMHLMNVQMEFQDIASTASSPDDPTAAASMQAAAGAASAVGHTSPCVYYGIREESAVTSVDVAGKSARRVGVRFGDYASRPLGMPARVVLKDKPMLAGPFLEVRLNSLASGPAEPIFLWSVDPKTTAGRLINDGSDRGRQASYEDDWLLDKAGGFVARSLYDFGKGRFVIEMKLGDAWKPVLTRPILAKAHTFAPFLVGLGAHEGSIVILDAAPDDAGAGRRLFHYYELSPDGVLSGPLEPDDAPRDRPVVNPANGRIAGFMRTGVEETFALTDPDLQSLFQHALDAAPGKTVQIVSTADDPRKMVIHAEGRDDPGSYYFVDFGAGTSAPLGEDYAQIPSSWFAAQSLVSYKAADGLEINALLTMPPGVAAAQNLPLVILPHDGPQAHDALGFDWLAQALASRGYLVLQPQYRGSDGNGLTLMKAGYDQLGRKMQSDLADGVRFLVRQGLADPKRVCIVGAGMGGYAALMGATDSGTYRCAASINGVSDPKAYEAALKRQLVDPEQDQIAPLVADLKRPRAFDANPASPSILASYMGSEPPVPLKLTADVTTPLLLVHETNDATSPVQQSRSMRDALRAAGKPVELVEVPGPSDHALATRDARLAVLNAVVGFLANNDPAT
jgi:dienelactone hydrolase